MNKDIPYKLFIFNCKIRFYKRLRIPQGNFKINSNDRIGCKMRRLNVAKIGLSFILIFFSLLFSKAQDSPYGLGFIPASIEEIDVAFPLVKKWKLEGQMDVQLVTPNPGKHSIL